MQNNKFPQNITESPKNKQEHMTSLRGTTLVPKTNKIIRLRGQIDLFEAEILCAQLTFKNINMPDFAAYLEEILVLLKHVMRCEVLETPLDPALINIMGLDGEQLREKSHHPAKYFKSGHFIPSVQDGESILLLNRMRTIARQTEIAACEAFENKDSSTQRTDLVTALNRISSALYIMMVMIKSGI